MILVISYKDSIYELPHQLLKELRLETLGYLEISTNFLNLIE